MWGFIVKKTKIVYMVIYKSIEDKKNALTGWKNQGLGLSKPSQQIFKSFITGADIRTTRIHVITDLYELFRWINDIMKWF